jgi:uncharacterized protein
MTTTCLIAALSACIGIAAGLLGVGSSILTILLLVHVAGLSIGSAIATSLVVAAASSIVALVHYSRSGAVMWRIGAGFSVASMVGAFAGGRVGRWLPPRVLVAIFAMTMAGAAIAMLWKPRSPMGAGRDRSKASTLATAAAGLPIGGLTGMVGLGGGFAVLPLLLLFTSAPAQSAVGTTLFVVALNTLAGLAGHFPHAAVQWRLAGCVGLAASGGSLVGARLAHRIDARALKRVLAVLMLAAAVVLAGRVLRGV